VSVAAFADDGSTSVDVIVATRNRPRDLARMLPTLSAQTHRDFRCLLVDQSDDPGPNQRAVASLRDPRILHIVHRARGKTKALNLALVQSSGRVVVFTDDDCTLPVNWIGRAVASLARLPRPGIVFGNATACAHDPAKEFVPAIAFRAPALLTEPLRRSPGLVGMGANMVVSRAVFDSLGLFDEDLGPGGSLRGGEECELAYRALRHGFVVSQDPSLDLLHWGARPVAGGAAREVVTTAFFSIGAGYGKHLRDGDWRAALVSLDESAHALAASARAIARWRKPFHFRRITNFWKGLAMGVSRGHRVPGGRRAPSAI